MRATIKNKSVPAQLLCPDCGNSHRFIEVMAEEAHVVDGNLTYLHLLEAWVDHYVCCECGKTLPIPDWAKAV